MHDNYYSTSMRAIENLLEKHSCRSKVLERVGLTPTDVLRLLPERPVDTGYNADGSIPMQEMAARIEKILKAEPKKSFSIPDLGRRLNYYSKSPNFLGRAITKLINAGMPIKKCRSENKWHYWWDGGVA